MKQLPEKIALDKAVHGQRYYKGSLKIAKMSRLIDMLANTDGEAEFSIKFDRVAKLLGKAEVVVTADLPLTCTVSGDVFLFHVEINSTLGFIDDLVYEEFVSDDMDASWVDDGLIKPLEIIEDELILAVPDAPFKEDFSDKDDFEDVVEQAEEKQNPFDVLKSLK